MKKIGRTGRHSDSEMEKTEYVVYKTGEQIHKEINHSEYKKIAQTSISAISIHGYTA